MAEFRRFPAWCDRILWWTKKAEDVQQHDYSSAPEAVFSDHKPVCATFSLSCTQIDWGKRQVLVEEVRAKRKHHSRQKGHQCSSIYCFDHL